MKHFQGSINSNYALGNEIIYSKNALKSNICNYRDAYIQVRGVITIIGRNNVNQAAFRNYVPFIKCITRIDGTTIDDVEDLDLVRPMYNSLEYSPNCFDKTGSLWFYSKKEVTNFSNDIVNTNFFQSSMYKVELLGNRAAK